MCQTAFLLHQTTFRIYQTKFPRCTFRINEQFHVHLQKLYFNREKDLTALDTIINIPYYGNVCRYIRLDENAEKLNWLVYTHPIRSKQCKRSGYRL